MTIKQFIEKAIEGGWEGLYPKNYPHNYGSHDTRCAALLDPKAWQAVGRVEGWRDFRGVNDWGFDDEFPIQPGWLINMMEMAHKLAKGLTIEQYLETL